MAQLSDETLEYLRDWLAWVERGAPQNVPYDRCQGLCANVCLYTAEPKTKRDIKDSLAGAFGMTYPFGVAEYRKRLRASTQHLDPKRLAWMRSVLEEAEGRV